MTDGQHDAKRPATRVLILWNGPEEEDETPGMPAHDAAQAGASQAEGDPAGDPDHDGYDPDDLHDEDPDPIPEPGTDADEPDEDDPGLAEDHDDEPDATRDPGDDAHASSGAGSREREHQVVERHLRQRGWHVDVVNLDDDSSRVMDAVVVTRPTLVIHLADQLYGEFVHHASIAGLLDLLEVTYLGSEPLCLATCQERARTHVLLRDAGLGVPGFVVIRDVNVIPDTSELRFPVILTQAYDDLYEDEGWSNPIHTRDELVARSAALFRDFDLPYLVEEFLSERRLHVFVLGERVLEVLPVVEADDEGEWQLALLDHETLDRVRDMARRAFRVLGCRDLAQVDIHLDEEGYAYVVDVRPRVHLGPEAAFWAAAGFTARGPGGVLTELLAPVHRRALSRLELDEPAAAPAPPQVPPPAPEAEDTRVPDSEGAALDDLDEADPDGFEDEYEYDAADDIDDEFDDEADGLDDELDDEADELDDDPDA